MTTPEDKKFQEGYDTFEVWGDEEDVDDCDYDLTDGNGCFNLHLKHTNCCFECELMLEAQEESGKQ